MDDATKQTPTEESKILTTEVPSGESSQAVPAAAEEKAHGSEHQKTEKEQLLDSLIAKRQEILNRLKEKNPKVIEARKGISSIIPALRGKGASHTLDLLRESDRIEFSIATEAYTPKKEKELIKRLREIKNELSQHKELDEARKSIDAQRNVLSTLLSEVKALEGELAEVRKQCDLAYSEVLAERKANRAQNQHAYEQPRERPEGHKKRFRSEGGSRRHGEDEVDSDMQKYIKDYDDTVSMEEIVVIEKKEKKKQEEKESE